MIEAYPLSWPLGYKRTQPEQRWNSKFKQTAENAQISLRNEIIRMGGKNLIVSSNVPQRKDGYIYADMATTKIDDPGVAIYFKYDGKDIVMCCDNYPRVWENIYALAKAVEALRGLERWGVSEFLQRAFTGFKALPTAIELSHAWYNILGVDKNASAEEIKAAYRTKSKVHHPDSPGGSAASFQLIKTAYEQGMAKFQLTNG
jgi:hypothetical protein